jgi:acetyl-CoA synthetase
MVKRSKKKRKKKSSKKKVKKLETNQELIIKTKADWVNKALVNKSDYEKKYKKSLKNNDEFWKKEGKRSMIGQEELHVLEVEKMIKSN